MSVLLGQRGPAECGFGFLFYRSFTFSLAAAMILCLSEKLCSLIVTGLEYFSLWGPRDLCAVSILIDPLSVCRPRRLGSHELKNLSGCCPSEPSFNPTILILLEIRDLVRQRSRIVLDIWNTWFRLWYALGVAFDLVINPFQSQLQFSELHIH